MKIFSRLRTRCGHLNLKDTLRNNVGVRYFSSEFKLWSQRIFSGIQPTGNLHLGNYFGAVQRWVELQDSGKDVIYSIVDLHSITLPQDPEELRSNILKVAATLIACGINPEKSILFQQSKVRQHTELCWILGCRTTMPRLAHLPQFKEKSSALKDVPLGLYVYPVLQCADILLYRATEVPVGEDQVQHLQLAQHLARNFNNQYGAVFPIPKALVGDSHTSRLRSLRDPLKKMSKSEPDPRSRINLTDTSDSILEKCKKAVTDFTSALTFNPEERPGVSNLITIHSLLSGKSPQEICNECASLDTGRYKLVLAEVIEEKLKPIREETVRLMADPVYLKTVLEKGSEKASLIAEETLLDVKNRVGLIAL
ncbi:tryptophan--tRNA ligase, mitochondrial [Anabrus simplex]|uniref:tryptophan--tRNA ligase, mitochondrial n=1 Tax=Anabrus simplex TaxID=316456 RepID=UPI0034DD1BDD